MPCIVTTKRPCGACRRIATKATCPTPDVSRHAVATLEDDAPLTRDEWGARRLAGSIVNDAREQAPNAYDDETYERLEAQCWELPESGGTVGPIEVEQTTWRALAATHPGGMTVQEALIAQAGRGNVEAQNAILDAYNARQAPIR